MIDFIGETVKVAYVQKTGWRQPVSLTFAKKTLKVKKILTKWEEHTKEKTWWERKHRVWYEVLLEDGNHYQLYWDRGPAGKGKDWILFKRVNKR